MWTEIKGGEKVLIWSGLIGHLFDMGFFFSFFSVNNNNSNNDNDFCCTGSFLLIELNDFGVLTSWFILKAHTSEIAQKWMDHISSAQVCAFS